MADDCDLILDEEITVSDGHINIAHELETFRQQWFSEIQTQLKSLSVANVDQEANLIPVKPKEPTAEDQAHYLFVQGVSAEQAGRLYDAIQYYRKAVQLVPDIESRVDFRARVRQESECSQTLSDTSEVEENDSTDLLQHIQKVHFLQCPNFICEPATEQKILHIGELPVEIIHCIFKWVVSGDLDVYSLEQLSCVSRGFYLCARDEELWRLICSRIWGKNCGSPAKYGSYRKMYIEKPHLRFNGCYISKCVYFRNGEKGLDNYYRPVHRVEYFRYARFFPDGKVVMLTSPDDPYVVLPNLNLRSTSIQGLLSGYYKLTGDTVTMVMKKVKSSTEYQPVHRYRRNARNVNGAVGGDHTFEAEFTVSSVRGRPCWQLIWTRYAIRTVNRATREESSTEFEVKNKNYPSMFFSRVRSFNVVSHSPLC